MYDFIDVTEVPEGLSLPSEALKINGEYIENQITGYRTLTVEGREALSTEISSFETGSRDGSVLKGKRYPARVIRITYQLVANSNEEFRNAYNKLGSILNVTNAELVFNDETDKYFIGTPSMVGEVPPGKNSVVGEFEILCLDPFKYSLMEFEAVPDLDDSCILLDYQGTYKSFPKLEAAFYNEDESSEDGETTQALTGAGDCGFVAFFTEDEKIIQLGDPDEADKEKTFDASQTLINNKFDGIGKWGSSAKGFWSENSGMTTSKDVEHSGTIGMGVASYEKTEQEYTSGTLLKVTSKANQPYFHYTITAKMTNRTENSAKITVMISARLDNSKSYFGKGYSLQACVELGGTTKKVTLKTTNERWEGTTEHKRSIEFTVTGLTTAAKTITGIKFYTTRPDTTGGTAGIVNETACSNFTVAAKATNVPDTYYLRPLKYGTGNKWHGSGITRAIPADSSGEAGAKNLTLTYAQKMCIGSESGDTAQLGAFEVVLWTTIAGSQKSMLAGIRVYKDTSGKSAKLCFYVNNKLLKTQDISMAHNNTTFTPSTTTTITKRGDVVEYRIGSGIWRFKDEVIKDLAVTNITITFSKYGEKPALSHNGLCWVKFVKNNCETWKDIPNKFSANDVIEADCRTGAIRLNGLDASAYGALGNDWEGFYLTPGLNRIGFAYSDWVAKDHAPSFKVKYREVFL